MVEHTVEKMKLMWLHYLTNVDKNLVVAILGKQTYYFLKY